MGVVFGTNCLQSYKSIRHLYLRVTYSFWLLPLVAFRRRLCCWDLFLYSWPTFFEANLPFCLSVCWREPQTLFVEVGFFAYHLCLLSRRDIFVAFVLFLYAGLDPS